MDLRQTVRNFILEDLMFSVDPTLLDDDTSLMAAGILDSTGMIELVTFIETTFGVQLADEEILPENLDSVNRVVAYVERKRG